MNNWFSIVFPYVLCLHCDEICIADILVPLDSMLMVLQDHKQNFKMFFIFRILIQKVLIRLLPYLTCNLI